MATTTAISPCGVSSSDSSDEDEHRRFMEAAVLDCHHSTSQNTETVVNGCSGNRSKLPRLQQSNTRPSLRPSRQDAHEAENELNTTPEFRAHVGRKLSQIIDTMIDIGNPSVSKTHINGGNYPKTTEGIRLFMKSSILADTADGSSRIRKPVKKRLVESSSSDSSEDERIASAAVSRDFIFKDSLNLPVQEQYAPPEVDSANSDGLNNMVDCSTSGSKVKKKKKKNDRDKATIRSESTHDDVKEESGKETFNKCKKKKRKKEKDTT